MKKMLASLALAGLVLGIGTRAVYALEDAVVGVSTPTSTIYTVYTDEICFGTTYDYYLNKTVSGVGVVALVYTFDSAGEFVSVSEKEMYPYSFQRETYLGYNLGEEDPNEFNEYLISYLKDIIGINSLGDLDSSVSGVTYETFEEYLGYLEDMFGMREDEKEEWLYLYRYTYDCLTEEEEAALEAERQAAEDAYNAFLEEQQKITDEIAANNAELESRYSEYYSELQMLKRTLPSWITLDEDLFVELRLKGYSFTEAVKEVQTIDYEEAYSSLASEMADNADTYKEIIEGITSDGVIDTVKSLFENLKDFFIEFLGLGDSE